MISLSSGHTVKIISISLFLIQIASIPQSNLHMIFLNVEAIKVHNKLVTDLFVKSTDIHQYLEASSCRVLHSKRAIPYIQA